jgi:hypothetical protein
MRRALDVLVLESEPGAASVAIDDLVAAGHRVHRCHEEGESAFPCAALTDADACPLEQATIDVAVTVRARPRANPAPLEDGVSCAIRRHIPVVVAGRTALNPFEPFAASLTDLDHLVDAVEHVAAGHLPRHTAAVESSLAMVLAHHGLPADSGRASVVRHQGTLKVRLTLPAELSRSTADMAAVRAVAAIRALDRSAAGIDVAVTRAAPVTGGVT